MAAFAWLNGMSINLDQVEMVTPVTRHHEEGDVEVTFASGHQIPLSGEQARSLLREVAKFLTTPEEKAGSMGFAK